MLIFYIFLGIDNEQTWLVERINLHCSRRGAKTSTCSERRLVLAFMYKIWNAMTANSHLGSQFLFHVKNNGPVWFAILVYWAYLYC